MYSEIGRLLLILGAIILILGLIIMFFGDRLGWFGSLPGDIRYERGNTRVYFPIVTMILISIVLTVIINLIRRLF